MHNISEKKHERTASIATVGIALISLLFSGVALYFTYHSYKLNQEVLLVDVERIWKNYETTIEPFPDNNTPTSISTNWKVLLANQSSLAISIKNFGWQYIWNGLDIKYINLLSGIYLRNGKEVSLPLTLEPGNSTVLIFKFKLLLAKEPSKIIREKFSIGQPVNIYELSDYLLSKNVGFFGGRLWKEEFITPRFPEPAIMVKTSDKGKNLLLGINAETTRGNNFNGSAWWSP